MWHAIKTNAFILREYPWREADRKYIAFSHDYGRMEFIGRGAQKPLAKLAPHLQSPACVRLELIVGKLQTTVIGVERIAHFSLFDTSLTHRLAAQAACALLARITGNDHADPQLYAELHAFLQFLQEHPESDYERLRVYLGGFLLRTMKHLGYTLELHSCLSCMQDIFPLSFRWHDARGGVVCSSCILAKSQDWGSARLVDEEIITFLRVARDESYDMLSRMYISRAHYTHFCTCVDHALRYHVPGYIDRPYWELLSGSVIQKA